MKNKVLIAMSGGIDSSVATLLLKKEGFDVFGVFMRFWSEKMDKTTNRCCSLESETRARKVAKILKIPFYVFDFSNEFKERVVNYFLNEYKKGNTPNPCVICNKKIKFGFLLEKALKLGADFIATGHYARKIQDSKSKFQKLLRAKDKEKDQSYFLWMINQEQLKRTLFPVGNLKRREVESLAKRFKLPVLSAKKSVELCFVEKTVNDFLRKFLGENPGKIVDKNGKILGEHKGLWFYTIGQRKGINLANGPYFVLNKDFKKNFLIVTRNEKDLLKKEAEIRDINWISGKEPNLPLKIKVKIRYRSVAVFANLVNLTKNKYKIIFEKYQRAITPGQSAVFYRGQEVLGGGIIN